MIHLVTLNPALDLFLGLEEPSKGKIGRVLEARMEAGGKALNVARFVRKWRMPALTWLGTGGGSDPTHVLYAALLKAEGLSARFLSSKAPIRVNAVVRRRGAARKYNHAGFELDLESFARLQAAVRRGDSVLLTGRLPQGMNPGLYGAWVRLFNRKGVRTLVDTSGKALAGALRAKPWFFKVNREELSEALGRTLPGLSALPRLLREKLKPMGLDHGAVTDGAEGAVVWKKEEAYFVQSSRVVRNRFVVGAGDGFLAGYWKGLESGRAFKDCARLACAAGTSVAQTGIRDFNPRSVAKVLKGVKATRV